MATETCQITIQPRDRYDMFHSRTCGRPVLGTMRKYGEDMPACKVHISLNERHAKQAAEADAAYQAKIRDDEAKYEVLRLLTNDHKWTTALARLRGLLCVTTGTTASPPTPAAVSEG
jgi:hypothetical protein